MKKLFLTFLLVFNLSLFSIIGVNAAIVEDDFDFVVYDNEKYDLITGFRESDNNYSITNKILLQRNLIDDEVVFSNDDFHHVLYFDENNAYLGYVNTDKSDLQLSTYIDGDVAIDDTLIIPHGVHKIALMNYNYEDTRNEIAQINENSIDDNAWESFSYRDLYEDADNVINDYREDFYLKTNRSYDSIINSTYGDITPLDLFPVMGGIEGLTLYQVIYNGNFSDGVTGWYGGASSVSVTNEILSSTGTGAQNFPRINQDVLITGLDYYITARIRVTNSDCQSIRVMDANGGLSFTQNNPVINQWYILSDVGIAMSDLIQIRHTYVDAATANGKVMEVDYVMAINPGNSPLYSHSAVQIDNIVSEYFEGIEYITNFELQSIGVNLFDGEYNSSELGVVYTSLDENNFTLLGASPTGNNTVNAFENIMFKPLTQYTFSGTGLQDIAGKNTRIEIKYTDGTSQNVWFSVGLTESTILATSTMDKSIDYLGVDYSSGGGTTTITNFIINEGTNAEDYVEYNSPTPFKLTADLLSISTDIRDSAYYSEGDWWKDQYVQSYILTADDIQFFTTGTNIDYVSIYIDTLSGIIPQTTFLDNDIFIEDYPNECTGTVDLLVNEWNLNTTDIWLYLIHESGTYVDLAAAKADLTGTVVYYGLDTVITTEITQTGSLIQESVTTLIQINNPFAADYDIGFVTSRDTSNTDYYYSGLKDWLYIVADFGFTVAPNLAEFEDLKYFYDLYKHVPESLTFNDITDYNLFQGYGSFETDWREDSINVPYDGHADYWKATQYGAYVGSNVDAQDIDDGIQYFSKAYTASGATFTYLLAIPFSDNDIYYFRFDLGGNTYDDKELHFGGNIIYFDAVSYDLTTYIESFSFESYGSTQFRYIQDNVLFDSYSAFVDNAFLFNLTDIFIEIESYIDVEDYMDLLGDYLNNNLIWLDPIGEYFTIYYPAANLITLSIGYSYDDTPPADPDTLTSIDEGLVKMGVLTEELKIFLAFAIMLVVAIFIALKTHNSTFIILSEVILTIIFTMLGWFSFWILLLMALVFTLLILRAGLKGGKE